MLLKELPALTKFYGLRPADIDEMTFREVSEYRMWMQRSLAEG